MPKLELVIGNKNYSSWSMRPWITLRESGIAFDEIRFSLFTDDWRARIGGYSPSGKVPVLRIDGKPVWDSLAILETLAELYPDKRLLPADAAARAQARSVCAEMHSGFQALRSTMPMNIRGSYPGKGHTPEVNRDIERIGTIWMQCRSRFGGGGELLFGRFTIADAMYAPVVMRFKTYAVTLPAAAQAYCDAVERLTSVRQWCAEALGETEVIAEDEPYASEKH